MIKQGAIILVCGFVAACQTTQNGYKISPLNTASYSYMTAVAPEPIRYGDTSDRFEVRNGDCGSDGSWSDCSNDRERAEVKGTNYGGGSHWYGWSIYVPDDYVNIYPTKTNLGQFYEHGKGPVFMFQNGGGGYSVDRQYRKHTYEYKKIIADEDLKGKWHDIVVNAVWSSDDNGKFQVWVDGVEQYSYTGRTTQGGSVRFVYGVYRSFISRYKTIKNTDVMPTQVVYFDEIRHGMSREDVDIRMIEKNLATN